MIASLILAAALNAGPSHPLLTLPQALQQAEAQNLDWQVAQARLKQAELATRKVWSYYLPTLTVGGVYTRNNTEAKFSLPAGLLGGGAPQGAPTDPTALTEITIQQLNQLGAQARLSQTVLAPSLWPAIQAAYIGTDVAKLSTETARRDILFNVAQMYYGAAGLKQAIEVQRQQLDLNQKREADAKVKVELGTTPKMALLRAQIDRSRSEEDLKRAENSYQAQLIALATLLNRDADFDVTLPPDPELPADLSTLPKAALQRPDLLAAQRNVDLAAAQRWQWILSYLPAVGVNAQYQWANVTGFTGENTSWLVSVGLNWTIFDGGLREANLVESGYRLHEAELNAERAKDNVVSELRRAELDMESAIGNRQKALEQAELAKENVTLVQASYDNGVATYLEVTDAVNAKLNADINAVVESLNAGLSRLRVLRAAGLFARQ